MPGADTILRPSPFMLTLSPSLSLAQTTCRLGRLPDYPPLAALPDCPPLLTWLTTPPPAAVIHPCVPLAVVALWRAPRSRSRAAPQLCQAGWPLPTLAPLTTPQLPPSLGPHHPLALGIPGPSPPLSYLHSWALTTPGPLPSLGPQYPWAPWSSFGYEPLPSLVLTILGTRPMVPVRRSGCQAIRQFAYAALPGGRHG